MAVDFVDEDQTWVARFPRPADDPRPDLGNGVVAVIASTDGSAIVVRDVSVLPQASLFGRYAD